MWHHGFKDEISKHSGFSTGVIGKAFARAVGRKSDKIYEQSLKYYPLNKFYEFPVLASGTIKTFIKHPRAFKKYLVDINEQQAFINEVARWANINKR